MTAPTVVILDAADIDYASYADFQKRAYRDLLARRGASDAHMTPEYYRWKYHPPDGTARVAQVVEGGITLSSSAMLPLRLSFERRSTIGWHCLDVGTVPEARGKGLFLATLRSLIETVGQDELFFAFPNEASIVSFLKLGCTENGILPTWVAPCIRPVAKRHDDIEQIDRFDTGQNGIRGHFGLDRPCIDRRSDYLSWRYTSNPIHRYVSFVLAKDGCEGFCVVRRAHVMGRDLALVMEITGSSARVQGALMSHAADWARGDGVNMMAVMSTTLPLSSALRTTMLPVPSVLLPKKQVLVVKPGSDLPPSLSTSTWALSTGDWDVF